MNATDFRGKLIVSYELFFHRMDSMRFQDFCLSLLTEINSIDLDPGSIGSDGGRDALYEGPLFIKNGTPKILGKWLIQIKHHNIDRFSEKTWHNKIIKDLNGEVKKLKEIKDIKSDSYLLITNIPLTWKLKSGTYDKVEEEIKPKFLNLGFINFRVFDGNKLKNLLHLAPKTENYFNPHKQVSSQYNSKLNDISSFDPVLYWELPALNVTPFWQ